MLDANSEEFVDDIFQKEGLKIIDILIRWLATNNKALPQKWSNILRENKESFFIAITQIKKINKALITVMLEYLTPSDIFWKKIPNDNFFRLFSLIEKSGLEPESTGIYTLIITICYDNNLYDPESINNQIFQPLHDRLYDRQLDFSSWERFKWSIGKDLYGLIEQNYFSKIFSDRNRIPEWDHCEFLRRSLVVVFLKYKWNPENITQAIKDKSTFLRFVEFTIQFDEGYKLLKTIYKSLKSQKNESSFHFDILKGFLK